MGPRKVFAALAVALLAAVSLPAQNQVSLTVDARMDIYRAGGYDDGSNGIDPVVFSFPARAWRTMTLPSVGGAWSCNNIVAPFNADGIRAYPATACYPTSIPGPVGKTSGYELTDFTGALAGVFLNNALIRPTRSALRFYATDNSLGGVRADFISLSPSIGQVFFIGDGLTRTGAGKLQTFFVPPTATHLYLGYVDSCTSTVPTAPGCFADNAGSLNVTVRLQDYAPDWVEPALSSAPSARIGAAMAYDAATYSTVLFGGNSAFLPGATYGDTWIWRGGWTQVSPAASPPPRGNAGIAYDPATRTVVLFGGRDNSNGAPFGDTWTWDGVTWTQQFPPVSPPARSANQSMAYDAATETVVLFGGIGAYNGNYGGTPFGDTWEWNGRTKNWKRKFPLSSPSPRWAPLARSAAGGTLVLFGGDDGGGDCCRVYYNETWTWNGVTWTQQSPATSPPARSYQCMAYDGNLGQVVVFGGTHGPPQGLNDTWAWNGRNWNQLNLYHQPDARFVSAMNFDPLSNGLVLFGGELTGDVVTNSTWLLVPVPIP